MNLARSAWEVLKPFRMPALAAIGFYFLTRVVFPIVDLEVQDAWKATWRPFFFDPVRTVPVVINVALVLVIGGLLGGWLVLTLYLARRVLLQRGRLSILVAEAVEDRTGRLHELLDHAAEWIVLLEALPSALADAASPEDRHARTDRVIDKLLYDVAGVVGEKLHPTGSVFLPDSTDENFLDLVFTARVDPERASMRRFYGGPGRGESTPARGVCGECWLRGETVVVRNVRASGSIYARAPDDPRPHPPYTSLLAVPIVVGTRPVGVLCLEGAAEDSFDAPIAQRAASLAAGFIGSMVECWRAATGAADLASVESGSQIAMQSGDDASQSC